MATSSVALGKVEVNDRRGMDIPKGWGVDAAGKVRRQKMEVKSIYRKWK